MRVDLSKGGHRRIPRDERVRFAPVHILPCTYECTALRKQTAALASPLLLSEFPSALLCPQKTRRSSRIVLRLRKKNTHLEKPHSRTCPLSYRRVWPPEPCLRYHVLLRRQPFRQWITKILCTNAKFMVPLLSPPSTSNLHSRTYNPTTAGSKYADRPLSICSTPPWTAYFYACSPEQRRGQASATRCRSVIVDL